MIEKFHFGQPTGTSVIVLMFYPRKSMRDIQTKIADSITPFLSSFWAKANTYDDVRFAVARDVDGNVPVWHSPKDNSVPSSQWPDTSAVFLRDTLAHLPIEKIVGETESRSPFDQMSDLARSLSVKLAGSHEPIWIHFLYFRDRDLLPDPNSATYLEDSKRKFLAALDQSPLSRFRYSIHFFSHFDPSAKCLAPSRIATRLQTAFSDMSYSQYELCDILTPPGTPWEEAVNHSIAHQTSAMTLMKPPEQKTLATLATLEVHAGSALIANEEIIFNAETNEVRFTKKGAQNLKIGQEIQVRYVPKK